METDKMKIILKNLLKLALVAHPIFFILVWIQALIQKAEGSNEILYSLEVGAFYYFGSILYVALSGFIYNLVLLLIPSSLDKLKSRVTTLILTCLIPTLIILFGERVQTITEFLVPVVITMCLYGMFITIPSTKAESM